MLVLDRRDQQRVVLDLPGGGIVEVVVLGFWNDDIMRDVVKLGFSAPSTVRILRDELRQRFADGEPQRRQFPR